MSYRTDGVRQGVLIGRRVLWVGGGVDVMQEGFRESDGESFEGAFANKQCPPEVPEKQRVYPIESEECCSCGAENVPVTCINMLDGSAVWQACGACLNLLVSAPQRTGQAVVRNARGGLAGHLPDCTCFACNAARSGDLKRATAVCAECNGDGVVGRDLERCSPCGGTGLDPRTTQAVVTEDPDWLEYTCRYCNSHPQRRDWKFCPFCGTNIPFEARS